MPRGKEEGYLLRIARNAGISAGGRLLTAVTGPLTAVITTRALGAELYGVYALAVYWTALLASIAAFSFGGTLTRYTALYDGEGRSDAAKGAFGFAWKAVMISGGFFTLLLFLFAEPFCAVFLGRPDTAPALRFFSLNILLTALYGLPLAVMTGLQEQRYVVAATNVLGAAVKVTTLIVLLFFGLRLYAALASSILQDLAILAAALYFCRRVFPALADRTVRPVTEKAELVRFSGTLFAGSIFHHHARNIDLLVLGMFRPLTEVGLYALAQKIQIVIYMPHHALVQTFGPAVAKLFAQGERARMQSLYGTVTKWSATFSLPIFLVIAYFHAPILSLFGKEYRGAVAALLILGAGNAVADLFGMSRNVITMAGRPAVNLFNSAVAVAVSVTLLLLLIPRYGIVGAAAAYTTGQVIVNALRLVQVRRLVGIHPFKQTLWKPFAAAAAALAAVAAADAASLFGRSTSAWVPGLLVFGAVYAAGTWLLGLDEEDRIVVDALKKKLPFGRADR